MTKYIFNSEYFRHKWCPYSCYSQAPVMFQVWHAVSHVIVPNYIGLSPTGSARTTSGRWTCPPNPWIWIRLRIFVVKITLEIVKRHPSIKHELIVLLIIAWNRWFPHDHLVCRVVKLSAQSKHDADQTMMSKGWSKYTDLGLSRKRKNGLFKSIMYTFDREVYVYACLYSYYVSMYVHCSVYMHVSSLRRNVHMHICIRADKPKLFEQLICC